VLARGGNEHFGHEDGAPTRARLGLDIIDSGNRHGRLRRGFLVKVRRFPIVGGGGCYVGFGVRQVGRGEENGRVFPYASAVLIHAGDALNVYPTLAQHDERGFRSGGHA
jgi:hypothetical protein